MILVDVRAPDPPKLIKHNGFEHKNVRQTVKPNGFEHLSLQNVKIQWFYISELLTLRKYNGFKHLSLPAYLRPGPQGCLPLLPLPLTKTMCFTMVFAYPCEMNPIKAAHILYI